LRRQIELAEGDSFYLLLDPAASTLTLMYKGAPLRTTPIVRAEVGAPRARRGAGEIGPVDLEAIWSGGTLDPPRVDLREEIIPPPLETGESVGASDGTSGGAQGEFLDGEQVDLTPTPAPTVEEVVIPKTPEELYPVPLSYLIRFHEGLTIEVARAPDAEAATASTALAAAVIGDEEPVPPATGYGWLARLARWLSRLSLSRPAGEQARLLLVMASKDADRLFRSLPPDVKLLILPAAASRS
jgi:hypothetical protein